MRGHAAAQGVPLDRSGALSGTVKVEFERYLRRERGRPGLGTMLRTARCAPGCG